MLRNSKSSAVIFGLEGKTLSPSERSFFEEVSPYGFILFARNVDNPQQVKQLVSDLRDCVGWKCPVLIDQEGGKVRRLRPPHWGDYPSMSQFSELAQSDLEAAKQACYDNAFKLGSDLVALGIDVDCAPVADLRVEGAHDIIGDRSFGSDPELVATLARKMAEGLEAAGVVSIVKHIPGHGRALADSHLELPRVRASLEELEQTDFKAFKLLNDLPWAMTAHIVFDALDAEAPVTLSKKAIGYIREVIGFSGVLISDDISMKALSGDFSDLTLGILGAGCDLVLHCNGDMAEMKQIASVIPAVKDSLLLAS